jgi:C4-dicarboxylate-specific signal transduction histidine kinase
LQRIFIPFFTTKSKGHGVGLALAHRVITDHGGTLSAGNAPEGGALFNIRLPL